jgi:PPM family protein phosphatase
MAPQIDFMVKSGLMDAKVGANHPDRNCLISVLMGQRIPKIDCPARPMELMEGDIVICSSDGLQYLPNAQIERIVGQIPQKRSTEIAEGCWTNC